MERWLLVTGPRRIMIGFPTRNYRDAMRLVLERVNPRLRQEAEQRLTSAGVVSFGEMALTLQGVVWKDKDPIPYSAIGECEIKGPFLQVKAEGKSQDQVIVNAGSVPNIFVFLDLVEQSRSSTGGHGTVAAGVGSSINRYL